LKNASDFSPERTSARTAPCARRALALEGRAQCGDRLRIVHLGQRPRGARAHVRVSVGDGLDEPRRRLPQLELPERHAAVAPHRRLGVAARRLA
jgi:hypothetical protein